MSIPGVPNDQLLWTQSNDGLSPRIRQLMRTYTYQTFNGVQFREKTPGSPTFSFDKEGNSRCGREFYIPWAGPSFNDPYAIWRAAQAFLGYPIVVSPQPPGFNDAVTMTGTTTSGSIIVSGIVTSALLVGQTVVGPGIPDGTAVTSTPTSDNPSAAGTITISNAATATGTVQIWFGVQVVNALVNMEISTTALWVLQSTAQIVVGEVVVGPGIPTGTTVSGVNPGTGATLNITAVAGVITAATVNNAGYGYPPGVDIDLYVIGPSGSSNGVITVSVGGLGVLTGVVTIPDGGSGYVTANDVGTSSPVTISNAATVTALGSPVRFGLYKYLSRVLPHTIDNFALFNFPNFFYATSIGKIDGMIPDGQDILQTGQFSEGLLSLIYSALPYNVLADSDISVIGSEGYPDESLLTRYVNSNQMPAGKWQTIPSFSALQYQPGPFTEPNPTGPGTITYNLTSTGPVSNTATFFLSQTDLSIDWCEVPLSAIPWGAIKRLQGCCNLYPFGGANNPVFPQSIIGQGAEQTVQFLNMQITGFKRMITGELGATLSYKFKVFPYGVNSVYNIYRVTDQGAVPGFQPSARTGTLRFKGVTNGTTSVTNLPSTSINVLARGMSVSGTGVPANTTIANITQLNGTSPITVTLSAAATAGNPTLTFGASVNRGPLVPTGDLNLLFRPQQNAYDI